MADQYCAIAVLGYAESGKSTLIGSFVNAVTTRAGGSPQSMEALRHKCDVFESERVNGHSEVASYWPVMSDEGELEIIVTPGVRKFWKWIDFSLADADAAVLVVRVPEDGILSIPAFLEPLSQCIGFGVPVTAIVVNVFESVDNSHVENTVQAITADWRRMHPEMTLPLIVPVRVSDGNGMDRLTKHLFSVRAPVRTSTSAFQLPINVLFTKGDSVIVGGKIFSGHLSVGDKLFLMPARVPVSVESICISQRRDVSSAAAGRIVGVRLGGIARNHVTTGMVLVADPCGGSATRLFRAEINVFNSKCPIRVGFSPMVSIQSCHVHAQIVEIGKEKSALDLGDTALVTLSLNKTVFAEAFPSPFGRLIVRHENVTIAVGVIREILD